MSSELTGLSFKIKKSSVTPASSSSLSTPESVPLPNPKESSAPSKAPAPLSHKRVRRSRILSSDDDSDAEVPPGSSSQRTPVVDDSQSEYEDDMDVDGVDHSPVTSTRAVSVSRKPAAGSRAITKSAKHTDMVPKRAKLPSMRKKPRTGGASTPIAKAPAVATSIPPTRPAAPKPKGTEVDLNNQDEYNKLFGISGSSTPNAAKKLASTTTASSTNYKTAEQKAREVAAARQRARVEHDQEWLPTNSFDLQASGDRIRAFEAKLWEEKRYMYMSQIASAWVVLPLPTADIIPHQSSALAPPVKGLQSNGDDATKALINQRDFRS